MMAFSFHGTRVGSHSSKINCVSLLLLFVLLGLAADFLFVVADSSVYSVPVWVM